jgi:Zn-dependent membrane protease YugP
MYFTPYFDPTYLLFVLPAVVIGIIATIWVQIAYNNNLKRINSKGYNGLDTVTMIAQKYDFNIDVTQGVGNMTDNYNPRTKTVTLSTDIANTPSVASVGIAAHEMGHVAQHNSGFFLMDLRTLIVPAVNIGTSIGYILLILGIMINFAGLAWLGIILFSGTTIFTLITLPVELDASRRALKMINETGLVDYTQIGGVRQVLSAAALTYVAATLQSLGTLLYFVLRVSGMSRD